MPQHFILCIDYCRRPQRRHQGLPVTHLRLSPMHWEDQLIKGDAMKSFNFITEMFCGLYVLPVQACGKQLATVIGEAKFNRRTKTKNG
jgi:hypothetical protein